MTTLCYGYSIWLPNIKTFYAEICSLLQCKLAEESTSCLGLVFTASVLLVHSPLLGIIPLNPFEF